MWSTRSVPFAITSGHNGNALSEHNAKMPPAPSPPPPPPPSPSPSASLQSLRKDTTSPSSSSSHGVHSHAPSSESSASAADSSASSAVTLHDNAITPSTMTMPTRHASEAQRTAHMFTFSAQKAGMQDMDKNHVQKVVYEMSKDSRFFQNSLRQSARVEARITAMQTKLATTLTPARRAFLQRQSDALLAKWEAQRDLSRTYVVADMDMFFAAVEIRDNPSLGGQPVAVGGMSMLSTTNYEARKFGVRAAMPGFIGKQLCPSLVLVPPHFDKYRAVSAQIHDVVRRYDPHFRAMSLDEVYCDITDYMEQHWDRYVALVASHNGNDTVSTGILPLEDEATADGDDDTEQDAGIMEAANLRARVAATIVNEMRHEIHRATQLTASAGVAPNTLLAKICSDRHKPNGQCVLRGTKQDVAAFTRALPVRRIGGIGKVMERILAALEITTAHELVAKRVELLHVFAERTAHWLLRTALGLVSSSSSSSLNCPGDSRDAASSRKSYSRERTFSSRGVSEPHLLETICRELCVTLAQDLILGGHRARTVTLKLKGVDFAVRSRAVSVACAVQRAEDLFATASLLLRKELPMTLRLMGVRASALTTVAKSRAERDDQGGECEEEGEEEEEDEMEEEEDLEDDEEGAEEGMTLRDKQDRRKRPRWQRQVGMEAFTGSAAVDPFEAHALQRLVARHEQEQELEQELMRHGQRRSRARLTGSGEGKQLAIHAWAAHAVDSELERTGSDRVETTDTVERDEREVSLSHRTARIPSLPPTQPMTTRAADADDDFHFGVDADGGGGGEREGDGEGDANNADACSSFQPCPVCGRIINASNAIAIALHVEACLGQCSPIAQQGCSRRGQSRGQGRRRSSSSRSNRERGRQPTLYSFCE